MWIIAPMKRMIMSSSPGFLSASPMKGSPILAMARRAAELRAGGRDIVDLTLGEPDFSPPSHVGDSAVAAAHRPLGYTPSNGTSALRSAARAALSRDRGLAYADNEVAVGCGAKQVIFNAFMATLEAGDEVIIPAPYWASYPDMVRMRGAIPVIVPCPAVSGFRLSPEALAKAITERTRWVIINAPGNPSGVDYSGEELSALAQELRRHRQVLVMSDEIYAHIRYADEPYVNLAMVAPDLRDRILIIDGVSKAYAMTGWRVGWGFGAADLITRISVIQGHNCTQTSALSQIAAVAALEGSQAVLAERNAIYRQRRDAGIAILSACTELEVKAPAGAFYFFPKLRGDADDEAVADRLLEAGVATVPGSAFGAPGHLRLSFATEIATVEAGCRRIIETLRVR